MKANAMQNTDQINRQFFKYVSQNILGMIGISLYILADTFFISQAVGADGITALNLVLPVYAVIFAIGAMIGVGSSIRFSIARSSAGAERDSWFMNALFWGTAAGLVFTVIGLSAPAKLVTMLGGDAEIVAVGSGYTRIFMTCAPFFIWNQICNAFVRNDGAPSVAMAATLSGSILNIVLDYVLMFPAGMGMNGAALATALSPLVGVSVCCIHFAGKDNTVSFRPVLPSVTRLLHACSVGVAAFVGEISSGVITMVFNFLILHLTGNVGVAAYGVVANVSLVVMAIFNGVANGTQPLMSECYGQSMAGSRLQAAGKLKKLRNMSIGTAILLALLVIAVIWVAAESIAGIFDREHDEELLGYAAEGLRLYFTGFLFAGVNIVGTSMFSALDRAKWAFAASILRGFVAIIPCAVALSAAFGMKGVWLAFPAAEFITLIITVAGLLKIV